MTDEETLRARGWREVEPGRWLESNARGMSPVSFEQAKHICYEEDANDVFKHGSVTYRATAEQSTSPLLAAAAQAGRCERDVIEMLFQKIELMRADMDDIVHDIAPHIAAALLVTQAERQVLGERLTLDRNLVEGS